MCICKTCGKEYEYNRSKGHTKTKCGSCSVNQRRFELKVKCIEYLGGKCKMCGYMRNKKALVFHHLKPEEKEFTISGSHCRKWTDIKDELDKCVLLCCNCHAEVHSI